MAGAQPEPQESGSDLTAFALQLEELRAAAERFARGLLFILGAGVLLVWHAADFVAALFDDRRRFLHDILFRTRLQHVTYG